MRKTPSGKGQPGILSGSTIQSRPWQSALVRELCFLLSDARAFCLMVRRPTAWICWSQNQAAHTGPAQYSSKLTVCDSAQ